MDNKQQQLEDFIARAGFAWGWRRLESWARRMAEKAVEETDLLKAHNQALASKNLELLEVVRALAGGINVLALIPADDFHKHGDYAAGLVNDAWASKNKITDKVLFGEANTHLPK